MTSAQAPWEVEQRHASEQRWVDAWIRTRCTNDRGFADEGIMVSVASRHFNRPIAIFLYDLHGKGVAASVHTPDGIRIIVPWKKLCHASLLGEARDSLMVILYNRNHRAAGNHFENTKRVMVSAAPAPLFTTEGVNLLKGRLVIIEVTYGWDPNWEASGLAKTEKYTSLIQKLESSGWEVEFRIVFIGVTGISSNIFGEEHGKRFGLTKAGYRELVLRIARSSWRYVRSIWVARCIATSVI
jgi:hypothetical protein